MLSNNPTGIDNLKGTEYYSPLVHQARVEPASLMLGAGTPTSKRVSDPVAPINPVLYYGPEGTTHGGPDDRPVLSIEPYLQSSDYLKPSYDTGKSSQLTYPAPSQRGSGQNSGNFSRPDGFPVKPQQEHQNNFNLPKERNLYPDGTGGSEGPLGQGAWIQGPGGMPESINKYQPNQGMWHDDVHTIQPAELGLSQGGIRPEYSAQGLYPGGKSPKPNPTDAYSSTDRHYPNPNIKPNSGTKSKASNTKKPQSNSSSARGVPLGKAQQGDKASKTPKNGPSMSGKTQINGSTGKRPFSVEASGLAPSAQSPNSRGEPIGKMTPTGATKNRQPSGQNKNQPTDKGGKNLINLEDGFMTTPQDGGRRGAADWNNTSADAPGASDIRFNRDDRPNFQNPTPRDLNLGFGSNQGENNDRDPTFMPRPGQDQNWASSNGLNPGNRPDLNNNLMNNSRDNNIAGFTPGSRLGTSPSQLGGSGGPNYQRPADNRFPGNAEPYGNKRAPLSPIFEENTRFMEGASPSPIRGNLNQSGSVGTPFAGSAERGQNPYSQPGSIPQGMNLGANGVTPSRVTQGGQSGQDGLGNKPHPVFDSPDQRGPMGPYPGQFHRPPQETNSLRNQDGPLSKQTLGQQDREQNSTSKILGRLAHHQSKVEQIEEGSYKDSNFNQSNGKFNARSSR